MSALSTIEAEPLTEEAAEWATRVGAVVVSARSLAEQLEPRQFVLENNRRYQQMNREGTVASALRRTAGLCQSIMAFLKLPTESQSNDDSLITSVAEIGNEVEQRIAPLLNHPDSLIRTLATDALTACGNAVERSELHATQSGNEEGISHE